MAMKAQYQKKPVCEKAAACARFPHLGCAGFSLIEMIIVMGIFGIVAAAIVASYQSQQVSYVRQEKTVEAQQNVRAALFFLERDIRRCGYDPSEASAAATSTSMIARIAELRFAWDANEDGFIGTTEVIRYALTRDGNNSVNDDARDGLANDFPCSLGRAVGNGALEPIADNVEAIEFFYHFEDGTTATECTTQTQREQIRSIDVSILVRSRDTMRAYKDITTYTSASGAAWGPYNDNHIRRLMISNIRCRNMGIES
jgi:type IV pilus assembly protein PilW